MSGHSKWSTIKRKKGANDQARGKLFSKLSKGISIAVKSGGGATPETNYKLRIAIDAAKQANMPKDTIDRAIKKASESGDLTEIAYEGFGPQGVQILVEAATDNKNRTSQELKTLFDRAGGSLGGPGSVSFNFKPQGVITIQASEDRDTQMLEMIDLGVDDMEYSDTELELFVSPSQLYETQEKLESKNIVVLRTEFVQKPISTQILENASDVKMLLNLMNQLDDHEDVSVAYTNADFSESLID